MFSAGHENDGTMSSKTAAESRRFSSRLLRIAVLGAVGSTGCGSEVRPADWEYISTVILQPNCATVSCHSRAAAVAGLDLSEPDRAYASLTGLKVWVVDPNGTEGCMRWQNSTVVCQRNFRPLVTPFNPEQSRLVNMLRARGATRMPPDRPLNEADIQLIEQWIRNGAFSRQPSQSNSGDGGPRVITTVSPTSPSNRADASDGAFGVDR